jgi:hypothetical protein
MKRNMPTVTDTTIVDNILSVATISADGQALWYFDTSEPHLKLICIVHIIDVDTGKVMAFINSREFTPVSEVVIFRSTYINYHTEYDLRQMLSLPPSFHVFNLNPDLPFEDIAFWMLDGDGETTLIKYIGLVLCKDKVGEKNIVCVINNLRHPLQCAETVNQSPYGDIGTQMNKLTEIGRHLTSICVSVWNAHKPYIIKTPLGRRRYAGGLTFRTFLTNAVVISEVKKLHLC